MKKLFFLIKKNPFLRNFLTIALLGFLFFFRYQITFLVFFSLIPFFYFADNNRKFLTFIGWSFFLGIGTALGEVFFLSNISLPIYLGAAVISGIIFFLPIFIFLFFIQKFFKNNGRFLYVFIFGTVAWFWELTNFPLSLFSFVEGLSQKPFFIQIMDLGGLSLLIFILANINFFIYELFLGRKNKKVFLRNSAILGIIFLVIFLYGFQSFRVDKETDNKKIKVVLIQSNFSQENILVMWQNRIKEIKKENPFSQPISLDEFRIERQISLTRKILNENPKLIVWPENNHVNPMFKEDSEGNLALFPNSGGEKLVNFVAEIKTPILVSALVENFNDSETFYNGAVLIEPKNKFNQFHLKKKPFFFGENLPKSLFFLNKYREKKGWGINIIGKSSNIKEKDIFKLGDSSFGVLICFENGFEKLSREWKNAGADFIVNLSNDALFESRRELNYQETASIFRAIENRLPFLRATNVGMTEIIDSRGRIIKRIPAFKEGVLVSEVEIKKQNSFFAKYGFHFIFLQTIAFFLILTIIKLKLFLKKEKQ